MITSTTTSATATYSAIAELLSAQAADDEAKKQAMQKGLAATRPLTQTRLAELCALGETMMRTTLRKNAALARVMQAARA